MTALDLAQQVLVPVGVVEIDGVGDAVVLVEVGDATVVELELTTYEL